MTYEQVIFTGSDWTPIGAQRKCFKASSESAELAIKQYKLISTQMTCGAYGFWKRPLWCMQMVFQKEVA